MKYLLMIYTDELREARIKEADMREEFARYGVFTQEIRQSGAYQSGEALQPTSTATTVRLRDGKVLTTDGPFAETKEQLGGYYLVECKNLDQAINWASKIPGAAHGTVEIRPVMDFSQTATA